MGQASTKRAAGALAILAVVSATTPASRSAEHLNRVSRDLLCVTEGSLQEAGQRFEVSVPKMRAYVTRFDDIPELEAWIAAGIPVIISARYDLLQDGRAEDLNGHLTVCRGFTEDGDLIINDPWTDLKVESVRHIYKRECF